MPRFKVSGGRGSSHDVHQIDERMIEDPVAARRRVQRQRMAERAAATKDLVPAPEDPTLDDDDLDDDLIDDVRHSEAAALRAFLASENGEPGTEDTGGADLPEPPAPSEALLLLRAALHQSNAASAVKMIADLQTVAEVEEVQALERAHPKWSGGRQGVLDALDERAGELVVAEPNPGLNEESDEDPADEPAGPQGGEFACPYEPCDFKASSEAGLEAHVEATHGA